MTNFFQVMEIVRFLDGPPSDQNTEEQFLLARKFIEGKRSDKDHFSANIWRFPGGIIEGEQE